MASSLKIVGGFFFFFLVITPTFRGEGIVERGAK